jgi:hypothetical protein
MASKEIAKNPVILTLSLKNRITPRTNLIKETKSALALTVSLLKYADEVLADKLGIPVADVKTGKVSPRCIFILKEDLCLAPP